MIKSECNSYIRKHIFAEKSQAASRLRQRKYNLVRKFGFPENLVGGSLTVTYRRCGKAGCHCNLDKGHPLWTLTYSLSGKKYVQGIAVEDVKLLMPLVKQCQEYRKALTELLSLNAQLIRLWRKQKSSRLPKKSKSTQRKISKKK
jgi:hypothetical protein